jgi:peptidoglycan lytic transglycosylase
LSGKHAEGRTPRPSRKSLPLLVGAAVAAVLVGTSVATLRFSDSADTTPVSAAAAAPRPAPASASPDRTEQRADRSEQRITAAPETTPSSSPTPSPTPKQSKSAAPPPKPPSGGGSVVSSETCQASFYTDEGSRTANGEIFHVNDFTAAHKTLAFNTRVRVTNIKNGKSVIVRINDRGPFVVGRCLDLTPAAFNTISSTSAGVATVKYEVLSG